MDRINDGGQIIHCKNHVTLGVYLGYIRQKNSKLPRQLMEEKRDSNNVDNKMSKGIPGIHHVTAGTSNPQRNIDFYISILGL
jgi:hypothetical protein